MRGFTATLRGQVPVARRAAAVWLSLLLVGTVAIGATAWRFSVDFLPLALDAETRVMEFRALSAGDLLAGDGESLGQVRTNVDQLELELRPAAQGADWLARFSPAIGWVPGLGHEAVAWVAQVVLKRWNFLKTGFYEGIKFPS